jgi:excisionase family DNA binding protein
MPDQSTVEVRTARISVAEISRLLGVGRLTVYKMLKQEIIPSVRVGRCWIVTRLAFEQWERTCGLKSGAGFPALAEVNVVN